MTPTIAFDLLILLVGVLTFLIWWGDRVISEEKREEIWNSVPLLKAHMYRILLRLITTMLLLGIVVYVAIVGYNAYWWGH
jgi:hypothetical protein